MQRWEYLVLQLSNAPGPRVIVDSAGRNWDLSVGRAGTVEVWRRELGALMNRLGDEGSELAGVGHGDYFNFKCPKP